ncbi:MAG TPA: hypothetical protein VF752_05260 [Thermoleophilaceae bacterium]
MKRLLVVGAAVGVVGWTMPATASAYDIKVSCTGSSGIPVACGQWHNFPVTLRLVPDTVDQLTNTSGNCFAYTPQPDSPPGGSAGSCTAEWGPGTTLTKTGWVFVDMTAPVATGAVADRPPDANGWYNHAVGFSFQGTDATSGIAGCEHPVYGGPDDAGAKIRGRCFDNAGNSSSFTTSLRYDGTAPALSNVKADPGDREVTLSWTAPADTTSVSVTRSAPGAPEQVPVARIAAASGPGVTVDRKLHNNRRYSYTLSSTDHAGNVATTSVGARPHAVVLGSGRVRRVLSPPKLKWHKSRRARYYNVQLYRGGRKIFSRWPHGAKLQLSHAWRYRGKAHRLTRGSYHWYVWPGYGKRSAGRYGRLLARGAFRVTR